MNEYHDELQILQLFPSPNLFICVCCGNNKQTEPLVYKKKLSFASHEPFDRYMNKEQSAHTLLTLFS